jgi:hypothetical protein
MKNIGLLVFSFLLVMLITSTSQAQNDKAIRPSPPAEVKGMIGSAEVDINYSTPSVKGRKIWGELVPYGQVWRTGANEATVFETSKDLNINGKILKAGKYGLFTIPGEKEWTFIFNSVWDQWGAFKYDASKDVLRIMATPEHSPVFNERMKFEIMDGDVTLLWENLRVSFMAKG